MITSAPIECMMKEYLPLSYKEIVTDRLDQQADIKDHKEDTLPIATNLSLSYVLKKHLQSIWKFFIHSKS